MAFDFTALTTTAFGRNIRKCRAVLRISDESCPGTFALPEVDPEAAKHVVRVRPRYEERFTLLVKSSLAQRVKDTTNTA
ncbi:unnamed protein product [Parascedosporium putredinis]|uniref:Uncharacterized protein n=1 Tax=Parascedosporium putredinis TaxID=1442378 RepID=A0A9P1M8F6_9PEZI|nr:unnamed protein product [Parascedosporium putredinis]CAI7989808.1 unnamed protein product [Parascedosporium putredinis]